MDIILRPIGNTIIELQIISNNTTIIEDITNLNGYVDDDFIDSLCQIIDLCKEHNIKVKKLRNE